MQDYVITTDSTVDLGAERMKELGVPYAMLSYKFVDGKDYPDDMTEESAMRIYNAMREGGVIVTSQANAEAFVSMWTGILEQGKDVLYIGFSTGLSGTVNSAMLAKSQLAEKYPDRKIYIVDSLCASGGEGMLLQHVLKKQEAGASLQECWEFAENLKLRVNHWYTVSELSYLKRGGRVGAVAATFADILGIKPVMNMDDLGRLIPREKVKGRKASIKRMLEKMKELIDAEDNPFIHITNADCMNDALYLKELIQAAFNNVPVYISTVGAVIGAHAGPGTLALFFIGKPRTR